MTKDRRQPSHRAASAAENGKDKENQPDGAGREDQCTEDLPCHVEFGLPSVLADFSIVLANHESLRIADGRLPMLLWIRSVPGRVEREIAGIFANCE